MYTISSRCMYGSRPPTVTRSTSVWDHDSPLDLEAGPRQRVGTRQGGDKSETIPARRIDHARWKPVIHRKTREGVGTGDRWRLEGSRKNAEDGVVEVI